MVSLPIDVNLDNVRFKSRIFFANQNFVFMMKFSSLMVEPICFFFYLLQAESDPNCFLVKSQFLLVKCICCDMLRLHEAELRAEEERLQREEAAREATPRVKLPKDRGSTSIN